jgi:hypothetical protein
MSNLSAALEYLAAGHHVIPCEAGGKRALVAWREFQTRRPSEAEVNHWWTQWPNANLALVLGRGHFAVDLDSLDAREELERVGVTLPADAPIAATGKGAHVHLGGAGIGDRVALVPGVDIRGAGYVVVPPSIHPSGRAYAWVRPLGADLPRAPQSLLALLGRKAAEGYPASGGDWVSDVLGGVGEGGRDATCTRLAGYMLGKGVSVPATLQILAAWADRCEPPFPIAEMEKCVRSIASREAYDAPGSRPPRAGDLVASTLDLILRPRRAVRATGLKNLDVALEGGFEPGTVTLIGGRPGTGKTAFMLQVAASVAGSGAGVLFVTLEMGGTRLLRRMLSQVGQVRFRHLKEGNLIDGERDALEAAAARVREFPLWIETRVRTVEAVDALLDEFEPGQIGLVMVDYLQKMGAPGNGHHDLRHQVEHVSAALARVAVDRDLPFVVASSLSRPDRASDKWRPTLSSLRESGALEADADTVLLFYREEGDDTLEVHVAKQRDGATSKSLLFFKGEVLTFTEEAI